MLVGSTIVLRAPIEEDKPFFFTLRNNVQLQMLLMTLPRANSLRRVNDWLGGMLDDPQTVLFVIADKSNNEAIGYIQLTRMNFIHGIGELGICVDEPAQGKGRAAEALRLLEEYVRNVFNIRKVVLRVLASNKRAIAFYKKEGYKTVGVHKNHFYQRQAFHDVVIMEKFLALDSGNAQ